MHRAAQTGSALLISLVFLLLLTMIGVASIQDSTLQERMAGNERNRNLAFQAAEAALRSGEEWLRGVLPLPGSPGFLSADQPGPHPADDAYGWDDSDSIAVSDANTYLSLEGPPRFAVEVVRTSSTDWPQNDEGEMPSVKFYRITARAVGSSGAVVVLQSTVRRGG